MNVQINVKIPTIHTANGLLLALGWSFFRWSSITEFLVFNKFYLFSCRQKPYLINIEIKAAHLTELDELD
jgi:hypothetical protein